MERKKVLIITYNWPPAGGITVLRCLKIAKYLRDFGWEPVIYTAKDADYPYYDYSNDKDIPKNIEIIKQPIREPFGIFKKLSGRKKNESVNNIIHVRDKKSILDNIGVWIRGNFFIPDARCLWIKPSVKYLNNYLKQNPVDAIFTDGPPHTNTVIGCKVSKLTNIPWLADFQDPWTQVDYYKLFKIKKKADSKHKQLEQDTFSVSKKITIASPTWKVDLESIGAKNVDVIYYGYDEDDFIDLKESSDNKFTICHSGLLGYDRCPDNLFKVINELNQEISGFSDNVEVKLLGQVDFTVLDLADKYGIAKNINQLGRVPRLDSLKHIVNSWLLLLPLNKADNAQGRMPGKFYEYIRAKRPILNIGPKNSDVANIVDDYGLGLNCDYNETKSLKEYIKQQYENQYLNKNFNAVSAKKDISFFSNRNQTKMVANYLNEITNEK